MNLANALQARKDFESPTIRILAIDANERIPEPVAGQSAQDAAGIGVMDIIKAIQE